jgi:hypothetical protein
VEIYDNGALQVFEPRIRGVFRFHNIQDMKLVLLTPYNSQKKKNADNAAHGFKPSLPKVLHRFLAFPCCRRLPQLRSASPSSFPRLGLCLSFLACFLFSARLTGGGVPKTARDAAFTTLVARNFFSFFFFGT